MNNLFASSRRWLSLPTLCGVLLFAQLSAHGQPKTTKETPAFVPQEPLDSIKPKKRLRSIRELPRKENSEPITSPVVEVMDDEEEEVAVVPLPESVPEIPGPRKGKERLVLNKSNVAEFKDLLLAPVASWVDAELFSVRLINRLEYRWKFSKNWESASREANQGYDLDEKRNLLAVAETVGKIPALPFGSADVIALEKDEAVKARKILWNSIYSMWSAGDMLYDLELAWVGTQSVLRKSEGVFYKRQYFEPKEVQIRDVAQTAEATKAADEKGGKGKGGKIEAEVPTAPILVSSEIESAFGSEKDLLSREFLQLNSPAVVYGFAQLTWRYRGETDDQVWIYSPVIGKSRSVLSANRSDSILGGKLTLDDLFVWGTKSQSVDARVVDEKVLLLPFSSISAYQVDMRKELSARTVLLRQGQKLEVPASDSESVATVRGYHQRINGTTMTVLWNYELNRFETGAPWIPVTAVFAPREVWIIELTPRNPYYASGREVLVIDKESMLPAYKIVYGKGGRYLKTIVAGWSLAKGKGNDVRFPFLSFVVAVDRGARQVMTMSTAEVSAFTDSKSKTVVELGKLFDISQHSAVDEDK